MLSTATLEDFTVGDRVETAPHTDTWMSGDRYGAVTKIGRSYIYVRLERSGRELSFAPSFLTVVAG